MTKRGSDQDRRGESLLDQRIVKSVQIGELTVVLLDSDDFKEGDPMVGRNIVAFDEDRNMAWRIEDHGIKIKDWEGVEAPEAFFGLWVENDGKTLKAGGPHAIFEVDPETGRLLSIETIHR